MNDLANNIFLSRSARPTAEDVKRFEDIAYSWNTLQNVLQGLDEKALVKLFRWEFDNEHRIHILNRIKSRHNRVRDQRERLEIFGA